MEFNKDRRWFWPNIDEECYQECCSREEVNEHFSSTNAVKKTNLVSGNRLTGSYDLIQGLLSIVASI